jgi:hypothetical protein
MDVCGVGVYIAALGEAGGSGRTEWVGGDRAMGKGREIYVWRGGKQRDESGTGGVDGEMSMGKAKMSEGGD